MDSKDKMLADFRKKISDLEKIPPIKDKQIELLRKTLDEYQSNAAGNTAVRNSLLGERELTAELSAHLDTAKKTILNLQKSNIELRDLNLELQNKLAALNSGNSEAVITEHQKTEL